MFKFSTFDLGQRSDICLIVSIRLGIKIYSNAGQEQGKGLEESAAHTHPIMWGITSECGLELGRQEDRIRAQTRVEAGLDLGSIQPLNMMLI